MFKKSLAAVAVLGAFAGTALAADVQLYGIVDYGMQYSETDTGVAAATHNFEMKDGVNSASRFGLKGVEDLGNGLKVGFVLENGFHADDGTLNDGKRLFDREAHLYVASEYGQLGFGRLGVLASGNGSYGLFGSAVSPISTGWGDILGHKAVMAAGFDRLDNSVVYKSPKFAGFNVLAQYSFKKDSKAAYVGDAREGSAEVDRQYAFGTTYNAGNLNLVGIVTKTNVASASATTYDSKDPMTVSLGGNYDFGVAKLFVATQYFKDSKLAVEAFQEDQRKVYDGYGLQVGANVPAFGGTAKVLVGYMDAEHQNEVGADAYDMSRVNFAVGYEYPLSKRTLVYTGAGYCQDSYDRKIADADDSAHKWAASAGIVHKF